MKYTGLLLVLLIAASCNKNNNTTPTPEGDITPKPTLDVQTEYRVKRIKSDTLVHATYTYNDDNVVSKIVNYYYYRPFHGVGPLTANTVMTSCNYDDEVRLIAYGNVGESASSTYQYDGKLPIVRYSDKYNLNMEEYMYTNGNLAVHKRYDIHGAITREIHYKYDANNNVTESVTEYKQAHTVTTPNTISVKKTTTVYSEYDNQNNIRFATPGLHHMLFDKPLSRNNPCKAIFIQEHTDGSSKTIEYNYSYEYNAGGYPTKITSNSVIETTAFIYEYNK